VAVVGERIWVVGTSGSGKTTTARRLADGLGLAHLELDSIYHQPGWTALPTSEFRSAVMGFVDADAWVVDGKYRAVRDLLMQRADTIVCLDHHRVRQTARVARRSFVRSMKRVELWNGNRERWRNLWPFGEPERTIVGWTWQNVPRARRLFDELEAGSGAGVRVVRLRGWPAIDAFVAETIGATREA
jgi:hypothetical protein